MKKNRLCKDLPRWVSEFFDTLASPKDKQIVKRILERNDEMKEVYAEIGKKMAGFAPDNNVVRSFLTARHGLSR